MTLIAVTNPSDASAESSIVYNSAMFEVFTPAKILEKFGDKLEDGAQVVMVEGDRVWQYLATRSNDENDGAPIALRPNNALGVDARYGDDAFIDYMNGGAGDIIEVGTQKLASAVELETFTVFGNNDDGEDFVAVVSATEDTVHDVAVAAGLVDEGLEDSVTIKLILKGDQSDLERVSS